MLRDADAPPETPHGGESDDDEHAAAGVAPEPGTRANATSGAAMRVAFVFLTRKMFEAALEKPSAMEHQSEAERARVRSGEGGLLRLRSLLSECEDLLEQYDHTKGEFVLFVESDPMHGMLCCDDASETATQRVQGGRRGAEREPALKALQLRPRHAAARGAGILVEVMKAELAVAEACAQEAVRRRTRRGFARWSCGPDAPRRCRQSERLRKGGRLQRGGAPPKARGGSRMRS